MSVIELQFLFFLSQWIAEILLCFFLYICWSLTEILLLQGVESFAPFELGMHLYRVHPIVFPFPKDLRKILLPVVNCDSKTLPPLSALQLLYMMRTFADKKKEVVGNICSDSSRLDSRGPVR
jgi:hypothetical protein